MLAHHVWAPPKPLFGRDDELAAVERAVLRVQGGTTAAVLFTGDIGVGKTEILNAAASRADDQGAVVLTGRCVSIGDASLHPLRQALRQFAQDPRYGGTPRAEVAGELLARLDSHSAYSYSAGVLFDRVAADLLAIADGCLLVLVIDDLHWADRDTERLLRYLLAGLGGGSLLLFGAARVEALGEAHGVRLLLDELRRQPMVDVIELRPLNRADTDALAESIVGRPLDSPDANLVWRRSGGNPFIVEVLARGHRDGVPGLPETLRALALNQIGELPRESHAVAAALAIGVEPVSHSLLAKVVKLDEDQLFEAVRVAANRRIVDVGDDGYRFHRGLFKEVRESALLPGEREWLHRRFAEALTVASGKPQYARLAYHWRFAGEPGRALPLAVEAAKRAEARFAFAEAYEQWAFALDIIEKAGGDEMSMVDRLRLRRSAAEAAHRSGEHERALAILEDIAGCMGPGPLPVWWRINRARYLTAVERPADAETEYEQVLAEGDRTAYECADAAARSAILLIQLGRYTEARGRAEDALAMASEIPQSASVSVLAGVALGVSQVHLDDPRAGLTAVEDALRTAERDGTPSDVGCAYLHLAELLTGPLNRLEDGVAAARDGAVRAEHLGIGRTYGARLLAAAANGLFRSGDWDQAQHCVAEGLRCRPSGAEAVELLLARARLYVGRGDFNKAESDLCAIETLTAGGGARHVLPRITLRAGLAMWRGRHAQARDAAIEGLKLYEGRTEDIVLQATLLWHGLRAEAEAVCDEHRAVEPAAVACLRRLLDGISGHSGSAAPPVRNLVDGYLALCDAELSRIERKPDPARWDRAVELWRAHSHPYPMAYARLRQAGAQYALHTRNAAADAAVCEAYQIALELGARPLADEITDLARRARVRLDKPAGGAPQAAAPKTGKGRVRTGPLAALTDREYQVLGLVSTGQSNKAIGEQLFISGRTVGVHVSNILKKLQVKSRVDAGRFYREDPDRDGDER